MKLARILRILMQLYRRVRGLDASVRRLPILRFSAWPPTFDLASDAIAPGRELPWLKSLTFAKNIAFDNRIVRFEQTKLWRPDFLEVFFPHRPEINGLKAAIPGQGALLVNWKYIGRYIYLHPIAGFEPSYVVTLIGIG